MVGLGIGLGLSKHAPRQGVPGWLSGAAPYLEMDIEAGVYTLNGRAYATFAEWWAAVGGSYSRSGNKRYIGADKRLAVAGQNVWPVEYDPSDGSLRGFSVHPAVTARGTNRRDLTNAAWAKTSCTAALDQTGLDGTANAASSLTATAANATCLQSIADATARNRCLPVYLKRIAGTGSVYLTVDGGTTWTDVTARLVSGEWSDCYAYKQAVANPSWGIKLATSGDAVAWDFGRCVDGGIPGPPLADGESNSPDTAFIPVSGLSAYQPGEGVMAVRAMDARENTDYWATLLSLYTDNNNFVEFMRQSDTSMNVRVKAGGTTYSSAARPPSYYTPFLSRLVRRPAWYAYSYAVGADRLTSDGKLGAEATAIGAVPAATYLQFGYGQYGQSSAYISGVRLYRKRAATDRQLTNFGASRKPFVVHGDSVAAGTGASQLWLQWANKLAKGLVPMRGRAAAAVGGTTSAQALAAIVADTYRRDFRYLVWTGHNDSDAATVLANLVAIDALLGGNVLIGTVLIGPSDNAGTIAWKTTLNAQIVSTFGTRAIDFQAAFAAAGGSLFADTIHPNDAGHAVAYAAALSKMQAIGW